MTEHNKTLTFFKISSGWYLVWSVRLCNNYSYAKKKKKRKKTNAPRPPSPAPQKYSSLKCNKIN